MPEILLDSKISGYYPGLMGPRPGAPDSETQKQITEAVRAYNKLNYPNLGARVTEVPYSDKSKFKTPVPLTKRTSNLG